VAALEENCVPVRDRMFSEAVVTRVPVFALEFRMGETMSSERLVKDSERAGPPSKRSLTWEPLYQVDPPWLVPSSSDL
jgi:hypothetical protein